MYPTLNALVAHTAAWANSSEYPAILRKDELGIFRARHEKHHHPAQPASFMVDPVNLKMQGELESNL